MSWAPAGVEFGIKLVTVIRAEEGFGIRGSRQTEETC